VRRRLFPGSAALWRAAAVAGVLTGALIAYELARRSPVTSLPEGLVLLALPLLAYAAVRLLALAADGRRGRVPAVLVIACIAFLHASASSLVTPAFRGPDERDHFAYVQYLAETGDAPCQGCARPRYSSEERLALRGVESHARRDDGGGTTTAASHAPPYYGLMTLGYAAGGSAFDRLAAMRLMSALLGALTAALCFLAVRELLPGRPLPAVLAGLVVALQPMFAFVSGALNNDNGVNAVMALLAYLLVRALRRGLSVPLAAGIGAALVLAPLMKVTGFAAVPPTLVALAFLARRRHPRTDLPAWLALIATVAGLELVWSRLAGGFSRTIYSTPDGGSFGSQPVLHRLADDPLGYLSYLAHVFVPGGSSWPAFETYVERGFAAFGQGFTIEFPLWVYVVIAMAIAATAALAVRALVVHRQAARARLPELAVVATLAIAVVAGVHLAFYGLPTEARALGEQGRYAFTAMPAWAAVAAAASLGAGRRWAGPVAALLVTSLAGLSAAAMLLALSGFYA
jgi:4-amino-4-deoxy-L-arabinose transferase-like glycosyltransferase